MKYLLIILAIITFTACEEVIILELNSSEQRIVIEANIDATNGLCKVELSKSGDFYETNNFDKVFGADITINTSAGNSYSLIDKGNGSYTTENIVVTPNETVDIIIKLTDNQEFFANAIVPFPVLISDIKFEKKILAPGGLGGGHGGEKDNEYSLSVLWNDSVDEKNYNRIKIYNNGEYQSEIYALYNDKLQNGNSINMPIIRQSFALGDTINVALLSCNKSYFDYFADIANSDGRGFSAPTPYNPNGNIEGNALGYFGIWYVSNMEKVVE